MSLTVWDCLGVLIITVAFYAGKVISYLYPERPDVYAELSYMQEHVAKLESKASDLERDVTALKFAGSVRSK